MLTYVFNVKETIHFLSNTKYYV